MQMRGQLEGQLGERQGKDLTVGNCSSVGFSPGRKLSLRKTTELGSYGSVQFSSNAVLVPTVARPMTQQYSSNLGERGRRKEVNENREKTNGVQR